MAADSMESKLRQARRAGAQKRAGGWGVGVAVALAGGLWWTYQQDEWRARWQHIGRAGVYAYTQFIERAGGQSAVNSHRGDKNSAPGVATAAAANNAAGAAGADSRAQFVAQLAQYEGVIEAQIEALGVARWEAEKAAELARLKARAVAQFAAGEYRLARQTLAAAQALAAQTAARHAELLAAARLAASEAFAADHAEAAQRALRQALQLAPQDADLLARQARLEVWPQVRAQLRQADLARAENRPDQEAAALARAVALDGARPALKARLTTLRADLKQQRFSAAMGRAHRALAAGELAAAQQHIAAAGAIFPARAALDAVTKKWQQARAAQQFENQMQRGEAATQSDDWPAAARHFEAALAAAPQAESAYQQRALARQVLAARQSILSLLAQPHRLGETEVAAAAAAHIYESAALAARSPGLAKIRADLSRLLAAYQAPVEVAVLSDGNTHIAVRGEGQVGKTRRRVIRVKPGRRVFEASRAGYQSKLLTVDLKPGADLVEITLLCDEKI